MKYKSGLIYKGVWRNNLYNGKGKLTKSCGWFCDGMWLEGKQNGTCRMKDPQNDYEYEGDWLNGLKEGHGVEMSQGFNYTGTFLEDLRHGSGTESSPKGSLYEGNWYRGVKNGKVTLRHANGLLEHQVWKHGRIIESPQAFVPMERPPL